MGFPQQQSDPPSRVFGGRYRVTGTLGQGGMGQVLEVEHIALGNRFAMKVVRVGDTRVDLVQRFQREARALAAVKSPRVAQVIDFGVEPSVGPYYVMELLDGETLEARLQRDSALPLEDAIGITIDVALSLAEVHDVGIVHRDVKPSNIGLCRGAVPVKMLDFGLAASIDHVFLEKITKSQQILGSMPYMAPEQFDGAPPTPSVDLWALGVVFYEMLTGQLPFHADSTAALMRRIVTDPVTPPSLRAGNVPVEVDEVVARLMDKNPARRWASGYAVAEALRQVLRLLETRRSGASLPPTRYGLSSVPPSQTTSISSPTWTPPSPSIPPADFPPTMRRVAKTVPMDPRPIVPSHSGVTERPVATPSSINAATLVMVGLGAALVSALSFGGLLWFSDAFADQEPPAVVDPGRPPEQEMRSDSADQREANAGGPASSSTPALTDSSSPSTAEPPADRPTATEPDAEDTRASPERAPNPIRRREASRPRQRPRPAEVVELREQVEPPTMSEPTWSPPPREPPPWRGGIITDPE